VQPILSKDSKKRARKMKFTSIFSQRVHSIFDIYIKDSKKRARNRPVRKTFLKKKSQKTDFFRIFSESLKIFASEIKQKAKLNR
jgi:hypothetical protein